MAKTKPIPRPEIGERLRKLMEDTPNLSTQMAIAKRTGIGQTTVGRILRGEVDPSAENMRKIADAFKTTVEYLLTGSITVVRKFAQEADANVEPGPDLRGNVPLISWVQAGNWEAVIDNFAPGDAEDWLPCPRKFGPHAFALRVRGVSMEPKYQDGDIIFVDPDAQAEHGKNIVVRLDDEHEATFKQLVMEGGQKFLRALNPDWPGPKLIPINGNATICGVVIGKWVPE